VLSNGKDLLYPHQGGPKDYRGRAGALETGSAGAFRC
jgi:hypothetical protein